LDRLTAAGEASSGSVATDQTQNGLKVSSIESVTLSTSRTAAWSRRSGRSRAWTGWTGFAIGRIIRQDPGTRTCTTTTPPGRPRRRIASAYLDYACCYLAARDGMLDAAPDRNSGEHC